MPETLQIVEIPGRIHALPEALVRVAADPALLCQSFHGSMLPHNVGFNVAKGFRLDDEKAAVDRSPRAFLISL